MSVIRAFKHETCQHKAYYNWTQNIQLTVLTAWMAPGIAEWSEWCKTVERGRMGWCGCWTIPYINIISLQLASVEIIWSPISEGWLLEARLCKCGNCVFIAEILGQHTLHRHSRLFIVRWFPYVVQYVRVWYWQLASVEIIWSSILEG